jgi:NADH:ubiquinone reductase (H+-translocating)
MDTDHVSETVVIAGAGYAGLHIAQRLGTWLDRHPTVHLTLADQHAYHQLMTELPRVATGTRSGEQVHVPLNGVLSPRVRFVQSEVTGLDLAGRAVLTDAGPLLYTYLVVALGSRPNDFAIPGLAEQALYPYSAEGAQHVWDAVNAAVQQAAAMRDAGEQRRLQTVVIGGGGATGVELAGAFAEELPQLARRYGARPDYGRVILVEAGPTILAGSSPDLIGKARHILRELNVTIRTNAPITEASPQGFRLENGEVISGGVFVWAGGVTAPAVIQRSGLPIGPNGRINVDPYLRAVKHPEIFVAGDLAGVVDAQTGRTLPPLAQIALQEGDTVVHNLRAAIDGRPLAAFRFRNKGFVVSVGNRRGVAELAGLTTSGRLAHALKDAIDWEYRTSVKHLRGWAVV